MTQETTELELSIERVRKLHVPHQTLQYRGGKELWLTGCEQCMETGSDYEYFVEYPCPTIKALDGK
jgi:hypothetical protein